MGGYFYFSVEINGLYTMMITFINEECVIIWADSRKSCDHPAKVKNLYIRTVWQRTQEEHDSYQKICNFLLLERVKLLNMSWMQHRVQLQWTICLVTHMCSWLLALTFGPSKERSETKSLSSKIWAAISLKVKSTCNMCRIHPSAGIS